MNEGKNGPKTDPCGKSALTICHFEDWPLKINLWKLLCKNDSIRLKSCNLFHVFLSLSGRPSCQTLRFWINPR